MRKPVNDIAATDPARGSSLMSIKIAQKARDEDDKNKIRRKKAMIVQVMQFLQDHGLYRTYDAMVAETNMNLQKFAPADNVDLTAIFSEYEEFVEYKYGRKPTFFRVNKDDDGVSGRQVSTPPTATAATATVGSSGHQANATIKNKPLPPPNSGSGTVAAASTSSSSLAASPCLPPVAPPPNSGTGLDIRGVQASTAAMGVNKTGVGFANKNSSNNNNNGKFVMISSGNSRDGSDADDDSTSNLPGFQGRSSLLKPLPHFPTQELNEIAGMIHREILDRDPGISFNDIAELDKAKQLLIEACVMPAKYPQFFQGILRPWNGVLLFGSPGTGKTMLAKAVATECRTTFFNISAASIVSKWRGDSEKLVRMLFDLAVHFAPSTVFIDELDSVLSSRASDGSEHEASRRMKTEFLVQMDGLSKRRGGDHVFVMAASNLPWDLDGAVLRRLEKRIHVGLPSITAREKMFRRLLTNTKPDFDFKKCAELTEGYSGADIDILCREAMMRSVRVLIRKLESRHEPLSNAPCAKPIVSVEDVIESTKVTRASVQSIPPKKYLDWEAKFGSTISDDQ